MKYLVHYISYLIFGPQPFIGFSTVSNSFPHSEIAFWVK